MLIRTISINDVKYDLIIINNECDDKSEVKSSKCRIHETYKEKCKLKFIEKLKECNINFDSEKSNYIDDEFDSVFNAAFESIFNK